VRRGIPVGQGAGVGGKSAVGYDLKGSGGDLMHTGHVALIDEENL